VRVLLRGRSPEAAAETLVKESLLADAAQLKALVEGGIQAVDGCVDPMVAAAREVEAAASGYLKRAADLNTVISGNTEKLGQAIFAAYGTALPPDATFTLRISDGVVKGFPYNGTIAPYKTSFYGLYARSAEFDDRPPFQLTERWKMAETKVDLKTPMNFVSTGDIIGGNSGSPVINRQAEICGINFDSNLQKLPNRYMYIDEAEGSRAVGVHSAGIIEGLRKLYGADALVAELLGTAR